MSLPAVTPDIEYDEDWGVDDIPACMTCSGEGYEECQDVNSSEGCWEPGCNGDFHTCTNCRGSGNASDQRYW